jgi:hypothetical protein
MTVGLLVRESWRRDRLSRDHMLRALERHSEAQIDQMLATYAGFDGLPSRLRHGQTFQVLTSGGQAMSTTESRAAGLPLHEKNWCSFQRHAFFCRNGKYCPRHWMMRPLRSFLDYL